MHISKCVLVYIQIDLLQAPPSIYTGRSLQEEDWLVYVMMWCGQGQADMWMVADNGVLVEVLPWPPCLQTPGDAYKWNLASRELVKEKYHEKAQHIVTGAKMKKKINKKKKENDREG